MVPDLEDTNVDTTEKTETTSEVIESEENNESAEAETSSEEANEDSSGEDEEGTEEPSGEQVVAQPKRSRAQERITKLASERDTERQEKEKLIHDRAVLQAQLEHLRQRQDADRSMADKRAEEERLALLDPTDRRLYEYEKQNKMLEYRLNQMELRRQDDLDRATFHAKAAADETYGKYADMVEQMYQDGLARGVQASREDLHSFILGKELKKDMSTKVSKKKEAAGKRIDSVTTKPAQAKGDVAGSKKGKTEEDRLRGVLI